MRDFAYGILQVDVMPPVVTAPAAAPAPAPAPASPATPRSPAAAAAGAGTPGTLVAASPLVPEGGSVNSMETVIEIVGKEVRGA